METCELTKKCQLAEEALNDVLNYILNEREEIYNDRKEIWIPLMDARDILTRLAIPEGTFIGKSVMKCLLIKEEDEALIVDQVYDDDLTIRQRPIKTFFDSIDELGITRINKKIYEFILEKDEEMEEEEKEKLIEYLRQTGSDETAVETIRESLTLKSVYIDEIKEIMQARPDYFEMGKPESEIVCDESCRGTEKVISREQWREGVSCVTTTRPDKCLYKDWL
jgi:hypothetical protein